MLKPLFPPFSKNSVHLEPHPPPADMTSDYVDAVLFQLRWEAFEDLDGFGYFMGVLRQARAV